MSRFLLLFLPLAAWSPARAAAETDVVLLIDVSTSMRGLFPEVKQRVYQEIDRAAVDDRMVLITFGEQAHLLARRRIRGAADRAYLRALVQALEPTERATYLTRGLDRGFRELLVSFEVAPDRERRLLWLSDDKNNPPPELGDDVFTMADLRKQNAAFEPEGEWFSFDAPIGDGASNELAEFLQWARRTLFLVNVRETGAALGSHAGPALRTTQTVHFSPQHGGLTGLEFLVIARVSDPATPGAPHRDVTVEPSVIQVRREAWAQDFALSFEGPPGQYTGFLVFESYARTNFRVEPERIPLSFVLEAPPVVAAAPEPEAEAPTLTDIAAEILETAERAPGAERADRPMEFGPVEPGRTYRKVIKVTTTAPVDADELRLQTQVPFPDGFALSAEFTGEGQQFDARLTLEVAQTVNVTEEALQGAAIEGRITFAAEDASIAVTPLFRRVLVKLDPRSPRWGRRMLPSEAAIGRTAAEGMSLEEIGRLQDAAAAGAGGESQIQRIWQRTRTVVASPYLWGSLMVAVALALLAVRFRPRKTAFYGELVVIKDPNPRKMRNVNLGRVAGGREGITIGSDARSSVRLQHESVRELHARILAVSVGDDTVLTLQAARGAEVKVNDQVRTERVRLNDKDLIAIGDYIFLFSSPEPQKRVVARFLDGSVLRGTPLTWDINDSTFQLLLDEPGGAGEDEVAHVEFGDLKAVFFVQDKIDSAGAERIDPARYMPDFELEVVFADGESLAGYALSDYTDYANRFYVVPKDDPSVISVLVERANAKSVAQRPRTDGGGGGGGWLQRLFSRS